jgi:hypothetical protein
VGVPATPGPFALGFSGSVSIPVAEAAASFALGGAEEVSLSYQVPGTIVVVFGGIGGAVAVERLAGPTVAFAEAEAGCGARIALTSFLDLFAGGTVGFWYGSYWDGSVASMDPSLGAGAELQLKLNPSFALAVGARYKIYLGLWQGIVAGLGMWISL